MRILKGLNVFYQRFDKKSIVRKKILSDFNFIKDEKKLFIQKKCIKFFEKCHQLNSVVIYSATKFEIDTIKIFNYLIDRKVNVYFPKILKDNMSFDLVRDKQELIKGTFNIFEPTSNLKCKLEEIDYFLVPCLGLDKNYYRLGYGKGFYDKALKNISSNKLVTMLPRKNISSFSFAQIHDIKIGNVFTETEENYNGYN
tara:strand:+ start:1347 stop:1940 length:594 start_codon:yes stop_codon:yes gene_type:complete